MAFTCNPEFLTPRRLELSHSPRVAREGVRAAGSFAFVRSRVRCATGDFALTTRQAAGDQRAADSGGNADPQRPLPSILTSVSAGRVCDGREPRCQRCHSVR